MDCKYLGLAFAIQKLAILKSLMYKKNLQKFSKQEEEPQLDVKPGHSVGTQKLNVQEHGPGANDQQSPARQIKQPEGKQHSPQLLDDQAEVDPYDNQSSFDYSPQPQLVQQANAQYELNELLARINRQCQEINQMTWLGQDWSMALYMSCGWSKKLCEQLFLTPDQQHKSLIGYIEGELQQGQAGQGECVLCLVKGKSIFRNICGHQCCEECWRSYLEHSLRATAQPFPDCIHGESVCKVKGSYTLCQLLMKGNPGLTQLFETSLCRSYADRNPEVKVCKGREGINCNRVFTITKFREMIECENCGNLVCLRCGDRYHGINECYDLANWVKVLEEEQREEARTAELPQNQGRTTERNYNWGRTAESPQNQGRTAEPPYNWGRTTERHYNWGRTAESPQNQGQTAIQTNDEINKTQQPANFVKALKLQKCPSCSHLIQRVQGCNHMRCRCKQQFCYVCGEKWLPFHSMVGDNLCYRYQQIKALTNYYLLISKQTEIKAFDDVKARKQNKTNHVNTRSQITKTKTEQILSKYDRIYQQRVKDLPAIKSALLKNFNFYDSQLTSLEGFHKFLQRTYLFMYGQLLSMHFNQDKEQQTRYQIIEKSLKTIQEFTTQLQLFKNSQYVPRNERAIFSYLTLQQARKTLQSNLICRIKQIDSIFRCIEAKIAPLMQRS